MTTAQEYLYDLNCYQTPDGFKLGGKGPAMKMLASKIKVLFPTLNAEDKAVFVAAIARGRFAINKDIWAMFCEAVGVAEPTPKPAAPAAAPTATNKVAGEILECCIGINLNQVRDHATLGKVDGKIQDLYELLLSLVSRVGHLQNQVEAMKKPATKRSLTSV